MLNKRTLQTAAVTILALAVIYRIEPAKQALMGESDGWLWF